jgi:hypothetical protein
MSRRYTYYGSKKSREYFLDLYPSEYYYSLNRGSKHTTDVANISESATTTPNFDVTPEDINQGTLTSLFPLATGEIVLNTLFNQGSSGVFSLQQTATNRARVADASKLPFAFNSMNYINFAVTARLVTSNLSATILDKDSTVYLVYRSQGTASNEGVFYEQTSTLSNRIGLFSDTGATVFRHTNYTPAATVTQLTYAAQQPTNTIRVVAYRRTGSTVEVFDENGLVASATNSETFTANTFFELGRQGAGGLNFTGFCGAVIVRTSADDNTTLNNIINFLKTEYGI